jgi:hypothetical protein
MIVSNVSETTKALTAYKATALTAAGSGDNTEITGNSIDLMGYTSLEIVTHYTTTLTAEKTLSLLTKYETSANGSDWNTAVTLQASTVVRTGATTAVDGVHALSLVTAGLPRYIRFKVTPDLSHSGTDTATVTGVVVLGGAQVVPAV